MIAAACASFFGVAAGGYIVQAWRTRRTDPDGAKALTVGAAFFAGYAVAFVVFVLREGL